MTAFSISSRAPLRAWLATVFLSSGLMGPVMAASEPEASQQGRFDVLEYQVDGNSLLDSAAIERAIMPHMGPGKTLATVEQARAALERQYRDAGYLTVLVSIPEQSTATGVIQLQVTEAPVGKLRVVGSQFHTPSDIKAGVPAVAEGTVPNFLTLQKQLSGVNRTADLRVAPVLKPGKAPGTVEVQLEVEDQLPLHGSVELNNQYSLNTTTTRLAASVRYDNLWQKGHSASLSLQLSPQDIHETRVAVVNYMLPVGRSGDTVSLYAVSSRSKFASIYNSPGLSVLGNNDVLGVRYALALEGTDDYAQSLSGGLDHKRALQLVGVDNAFDGSPTLRYTPLTLNYRGTWLKQGATEAVVDVTATVGLRGFLGDDDERFDATRAGASASFVALRTGLEWSREIGRWALDARLDSQLASGPLVSGEQFSAGGAASVRGYLEGERAADQGLRISLEATSPQVKLGLQGMDWRLNGVLFADAAMLRVIDAGQGESSKYQLAGLGGGLRLSGPWGMGFYLDVARALLDGDVDGGGTAKGDWRAHLRWVMEF
jgi:hemolysin activation/secretion protein